ncbi:hypothetical protein LguiB_021673 [Lonicera macranthoides]
MESKLNKFGLGLECTSSKVGSLGYRKPNSWPLFGFWRRMCTFVKKVPSIMGKTLFSYWRPNDVCSLKFTRWRDCSFIQTIDFSSIEGISQNPKCFHMFNEHMIKLNPPNSIKINPNGGDGQCSEDTIVAVPLDSRYFGNENFDGNDCNLDNGESRIDSNGGGEQPYELNLEDDCLLSLPMANYKQSLPVVSNPSENNVKEIKINITPVFVTDEFTDLRGLEKFIDISMRCVVEAGADRPAMSEVVKEIENAMEMAGLNPNVESASTSASYEGVSKGYEHPYSNESLFVYSGAYIPSKLEPKGHLYAFYHQQQQELYIKKRAKE